MILHTSISLLIVERDDAARVPLKPLQECDVALRVELDGTIKVLKDRWGALPLAQPSRPFG